MNDRTRVILVDDEAPARSLIREYLEAHPDIEVVAECENGFEAVKRCGELGPDLLFLDVQMPKLTGFEVLELLSPPPPVIFCTAFDEYALRAFEAHAVDYLLKPVGRERLGQALDRFRAGRAAAAPAPTPGPGEARAAALAAAARPAGQPLERILVRDGASVQVLPVDQIDYLEAQDDYVAIHVGSRSWLKTRSLAEIEAELPPGRFVRIHRSYVLNLDRLTRVELVARESRVAILKGGKELPVSRAGYGRLRERL